MMAHALFILQNCDSYEARLKTLGRSTSGEDESSKRQSQYADSDVAPEELDSVSQSKLKQSSDGIINCQGGTVPPGEARRPSKIDIPCVVSIEQEEDRNCASCRKCCLCYHLWLKFQNFLFKVTHDMLFESAVTVCIILNTAFLAVEHHGMSEELKHVLEIGNKVFTTFFTTGKY